MRESLTELIAGILSDHEWHSAKEIINHCLRRSDRNRQAIKVSLHNMVSRNRVKRTQAAGGDTESHYRILEGATFGVSPRLALLDQHLRKAREGNATA